MAVVLLAVLAVVAVTGIAVWAVVTQPTWPAQLQKDPDVSVDPQRLERRVRRIVAVEGRSFGNPEQMGRVAEFVRQEMESAGAAVTEQPFRVQGGIYRNVCGAFGPPTRERVIVGAHYDSADENPGADDNASGVAGLLELAELMAGAGLTKCVELVAFALEEPPAFATDGMGSHVYARSLRDAHAQVIGMLSLEMIGCFSDRPGSQEFPLPLLGLFYPSRGNFIAVVSRLQDTALVRSVKTGMRRGTRLPVRSLNGPGLIPGVALSDHLAFWLHGYPAAMITDTAFYRNPRYHSGADTPETLDYNRMSEVVKGVYAALLALASR